MIPSGPDGEGASPPGRRAAGARSGRCQPEQSASQPPSHPASLHTANQPDCSQPVCTQQHSCVWRGPRVGARPCGVECPCACEHERAQTPDEARIPQSAASLRGPKDVSQPGRGESGPSAYAYRRSPHGSRRERTLGLRLAALATTYTLSGGGDGCAWRPRGGLARLTRPQLGRSTCSQRAPT